jgi:hypothetical protein
MYGGTQFVAERATQQRGRRQRWDLLLWFWRINKGPGSRGGVWVSRIAIRAEFENAADCCRPQALEPSKDWTLWAV